MTDIISEVGQINRPCARAALPLLKIYTEKLAALRQRIWDGHMYRNEAFDLGYLEATLQQEHWPAVACMLKALPDTAISHVAASAGALTGELAGASDVPDAEAIRLLESIPVRFIGGLKGCLPESTDGKEEKA